MLSVVVFILGLTVGSFLNCVIYRLKTGQNFLKGHSSCPHCLHQLKWYDLIPVLSFILLKGKCRYCKKPISWQYPLVELITGLLFLQIFNFQFSWTLSGGLSVGLLFNEFSIFNFLNLIYYWLIVSLLIVIFVYDLKWYVIPDKIVYPAIIIALIFNFQFSIFNQFSIFKFSILSALGTSIFFLAIFLISRGKWLGFGDVKLAFFMGLFLGFPDILVALFLAFLIGAMIGLGLIIFKKKGLKSEIPFGPFLITGTLIALFWGNQIINWYLNLITYNL
ncbi:MAG: prepilin peptidase [Candidatus Nealsonbacteria bacterium CG02_land_8_20_14_3_00_34_20]|uniref:Prepilin peptidase n=1 Tax=Candidatus Nealsonbacteria bacterium CG02_land_8_20_14_3_00_34_20 TaxID=1974698 RepID=A0A2M7DBN2_9BACT|nr:MAG: prepilin peptidase [Candidatus Nealsonbacteria bacterium CG02_land_8_20_14_3_00_34_20]PIW92530.1 MAG: prepilin peptidase [Candidatus Nealsonbacteria bacterium CG_4_8_14_3_um_filter_34_13]